MLHPAFALAVTLALAATESHAKDPDYIGSVHVVRGDTIPDSARGTVFLNANRNLKLDADETGIAGVMVSNGREVVMTAEDGSYTLPAYGDMNLFITRPAGYTSRSMRTWSLSNAHIPFAIYADATPQKR